MNVLVIPLDAASPTHLREAELEHGGSHASARVGDADPLQAIADALPTFAADEIVIAANPEQSRGSAEKLAVRARKRFALPVLRAGPV